MPGCYQYYPVSVQLLQKHKFCTLDEFRSFINNNERSYDSHIRKSYCCYSVEHELLSRRKAAPFDRTIRFPDGFYIDMDCAKIRTVTKQFFNALYLLHLSEHSRPNNDIYKENEYITSVADAIKPLDEAYTKFADIIMSTDIEHLEENGIYCRETFEEKYGLTWCPKAG